jgi:acetyl-CoA hydrolase
MATVSAALKARVRRPSYLQKVARAEDLIELFPHGSYVGWSGFTGVGYPKYVNSSRWRGSVPSQYVILGKDSSAWLETDFLLHRKVPSALADHVEKNGLQGKLKFNLFVGASSGAETENRWARLNMIERRAPHQVGKEIARGINNGDIKFFDKHLSMFPVDLMFVLLLSSLMRIWTVWLNGDCFTGMDSIRSTRRITGLMLPSLKLVLSRKMVVSFLVRRWERAQR